MATKRRRKATSTARPAARRKTTTPRKRRSNPTIHASSGRRPVTRSRRRSVARRRNPSAGGLITQGLELAGGITLVGMLQMFVPPIGGISPIASFARKAGSGYLLGVAMEKFNFGRKYAQTVQLSGVALGLGDLINAYLMPTISGFLRPAPRPSAENGNGVQGIGVYRPGMQPFGAYRGLNGIATLAPGQQPFNEYVAVA